MATLKIASKANQATTFPSLLVASLIKEFDPKTRFSVQFEDDGVLRSRGDEVVGLTLGDDESIYGLEKVLDKLLYSHSVLGSKDNDLV